MANYLSVLPEGRKKCLRRGIEHVRRFFCRVAAAPYPGRVRRSRHPATSRVPCLVSCPAALRLCGPTGSQPRTPRKRSAAGQDIRHGTRDVAGWRRRLAAPCALPAPCPTGCEPVSGSCRPGKAQPPPGDITGTVPGILPGGASAEALNTCADFFAGWRLRLTRPTCPGLTASRPTDK
jgi:hypothetical protein